jgi:lipopolysaccharide biosynthesis glycosyltransferase
VGVSDGAQPNDVTNLPMVLVCAADDGYSMPMAVMLYTALKNYRGPAGVEAYILDGGISIINRQKIQRVLAKTGVRLHWLKPSLMLIKELPVKKHLSVSSYLRLLIPDLLSDTISKAVYLDVDIIVDGDLSVIWQQEIGNNYLLAVQNPGSKKFIAFSPWSTCPEITFSENDEYFNAGVLVINLPLMRKDRIAAKAIDFARRWPELVPCADQDALNAMCIGRWGSLDPVWNQLVKDKNKLKFECRRDGIFHYVGSSKPWLPNKSKPHHRDEKGAAHRLYLDYVQKSGWFNHTEWLLFSVKLHLSQYFRRLKYVLNRKM